MKYQVLLIDGSYLAHRSFSAPYKLTTSTGLNSLMIHSFLTSLRSLYEKYKPEIVAVAWESHGTPSWRRELCPEYKPPKTNASEYINLLPDLKMMLQLLKIRQYYAPRNEADDTIATLTARTSKSVLIFTVDKDIMQIVSDEEPHHILCQKKIFNYSQVTDKFKVRPDQIPDFLAIVGDSSDNITGIKGIGPKKASEMLLKYDSLEFIPYHLFKNGKQDFLKASLNKKLTLLNTDANVKTLYKPGSLIAYTIEDMIDKYELKNIKKDIDKYKEIGNERKSC